MWSPMLRALSPIQQYVKHSLYEIGIPSLECIYHVATDVSSWQNYNQLTYLG